MNPPRAQQLGLIGCPVCSLVFEQPQPGSACSRCGVALHPRIPASIERCWALLIAAMICYIPANMLPVMHAAAPGSPGTSSTILGGIVDFWHAGSYGIALLIFTASVGVPCAKFLSLGLLLVCSQLHSDWARAERTQLYHLVERIGYWSMLDVLVVAVVTGLVKFGALGDIEPRIGILFFGLVVILTMLCGMNFDPKLTWDGQTA